MSSNTRKLTFFKLNWNAVCIHIRSFLQKWRSMKKHAPATCKCQRIKKAFMLPYKFFWWASFKSVRWSFYVTRRKLSEIFQKRRTHPKENKKIRNLICSFNKYRLTLAAEWNMINKKGFSRLTENTLSKTYWPNNQTLKTNLVSFHSWQLSILPFLRTWKGKNNFAIHFRISTFSLRRALLTWKSIPRQRNLYLGNLYLGNLYLDEIYTYVILRIRLM